MLRCDMRYHIHVFLYVLCLFYPMVSRCINYEKAVQTTFLWWVGATTMKSSANNRHMVSRCNSWYMYLMCIYLINKTLCVYSRAEWKIQKLHFSKSERNFRTTSQHWFQNCFWNHDWTIILLRNLAKISYRIQRQIWNHDASQFQVISLKIGIETMFLQTPSQP